MILSDKEHQVVREGMAAANLLANEDLRTIINSLMFEGYATFTETKPHESGRREELYNLMQGLKAIEAELRHRVDQYQEIERRMTASEDDASDDDALINDDELGD